jgi:aryl carrier-like protein
LNPYCATFSHTLPSDYGNRLICVFQGERIEVLALGREEMLIMKCFAHRQKDVGHAKALIQAGADADRVFEHIEQLRKKGIPLADKAQDFLEDVMEQVDS